MPSGSKGNSTSRSPRNSDWLGLKQELPHGRRLLLTVLSFIAPIALWSIVSYVPWIWHPSVKIIAAGGVEYFEEGDNVSYEDFVREKAAMQAQGKTLPEGKRINPPFLPAPHEVARALYTAFTTEPGLPDEPWMHESLGQSVRTIVWAFFLSSIFGVPLGILCGTYRFFSRLQEPFIEFFRYLPAPAFGALSVAVLGIYDGPKIAIIWIGTFFQQVLVIANTVRKVDPSLIEAAQTLGARNLRLVRQVIIPASISDIYTDMRILLGWAWTYLIVAEVVGTMSGITLFINQQARYRHFDNVYAAIIIIGIIGFTSDLLLGWIGSIIFPWKRRSRATSAPAKRWFPKLFPPRAAAAPVEVRSAEA